MSDLWGRPLGHAMKRKRLNSDFDIAIDTDSQDHFKRQNIDDGNDAIDLTPSHRIPDLIDSAAMESTHTTSTGVPQPSQIPAPLPGYSTQAVPQPSLVPPYRTIRAQQFRPVKPLKQSTLTTKPQFSQQCTSTSEPQPSNLPTTPSTRPYATSELEARSARNQLDKRNDESKAIRKWKPTEWNEDEFESDEENMSLATTMKLASELSLLKSFLELYRKFNIHLGGKQSPRTITQLPLMLSIPSLTQMKITTRHHIRPPSQRVPPPHFLLGHPPRITHRAPAHSPRRETTRQPLPRQHGTHCREDHSQMQGSQ